ncbi:MAG: hypothetical protein AVDCRST_MAG89-4810, partial [uncultured Gemmatimonadetes bacterium]
AQDQARPERPRGVVLRDHDPGRRRRNGAGQREDGRGGHGVLRNVRALRLRLGERRLPDLGARVDVLQSGVRDGPVGLFVL